MFFESSTSIAIPKEIEDLQEALFPLHRQIESFYRTLPWPKKIQKIVVLTQVSGGRGDIAAAAKAISLLQQMCPTLTFDWILQGARLDQDNPLSFLTCNDLSRVYVRSLSSEPMDKMPGDFLLVGPVRLSWDIDYVESRILRKISGPTFGFLENGDSLSTFWPEMLQAELKSAPQDASTHEMYQSLHSCIFPSKVKGDSGFLPMGLQQGSGVFLDLNQMQATLSRGYCCPSYLLHIQEQQLRSDILGAMDMFDGHSEPDYDKHSFNSGYAHRPPSWGKFIDCVAIHERHKHVVIVLNQHSEFACLSTKEFRDQIFKPERCSFLQKKGYGSVVVKGKDQEPLSVLKSDNSRTERRLTVIVRPSFVPSDMRRLQLASERLLATGDNSAVESWCARCILYLYEDVANCGCKWKFLQQQVDLAKTISPTHSRLLALFGGDRRLPEPFLTGPPSHQKMVEIERLLSDPSLGDATLEFCSRITTNYSFNIVLEGALKRTAWHHCIPGLDVVEADALGEEFQTEVVAYLRNSEASERVFSVGALPELGKRIQERVRQYHSPYALF
jgi:hypothetical protein